MKTGGDEYRFKEAAITKDFFDNFPEPEKGDDMEACNRKLNVMLGACKDMYHLAREAQSLVLLQKARTMKDQLGELYAGMRALHQKAAGGLVTASGSLASNDLAGWMK